jgi:CBS domain-containing protein
MTVDAIMTREIIKLSPTDTVSHGLRIMHDHHVRTLAVVDEANRFLGLFGIRQVVHLLLPKAAQIEFGLTNLSFMPDDLGELYHRLRDVGQKPVIDFLEESEDVLMCKPSTPLPEVLELLHQSINTSLPVVVIDGDNDRLVGMVSGWDVLERVVMNVFGEAVERA